MPNVLVPLLDGFEEIEAVTIIDVLRRAEIDVTVAGQQAGPVRGSHGIEVVADAALSEIDPESLDMVALPGGMPGAKNLSENAAVQSIVKSMASAGKYTTAICAAPMALAAAGVVDGVRATCYPGFQSHLTGAEFVEDRVCVDGKVVTSRSPGTALEFALELVRLLRGNDVDSRLGEQMLVRR